MHQPPVAVSTKPHTKQKRSKQSRKTQIEVIPNQITCNDQIARDRVHAKTEHAMPSHSPVSATREPHSSSCIPSQSISTTETTSSFLSPSVMSSLSQSGILPMAAAYDDPSQSDGEFTLVTGKKYRKKQKFQLSNAVSTTAANTKPMHLMATGSHQIAARRIPVTGLVRGAREGSSGWNTTTSTQQPSCPPKSLRTAVALSEEVSVSNGTTVSSTTSKPPVDSSQRKTPLPTYLSNSITSNLPNNQLSAAATARKPSNSHVDQTKSDLLNKSNAFIRPYQHRFLCNFLLSRWNSFASVANVSNSSARSPSCGQYVGTV